MSETAKQKFKIKPKLLIPGLLVVLIYFFSGFLNNKISFFAPTASLETRQIILNKNTTAKSEDQLMWWEFKDNILSLNYNNLLISEDNIQAFGKKEDNSVGQINLDTSVEIGKGFNGSFISMLKPINIDINGDGISDEVNVDAKADTIYTRGFETVNTYFEDTQIPLEVVLDGNYDLKVYFKNQLLKNAGVTITSEDGVNQKFVTDSVTGTIHISDMNLLRKGINILYSDSGKYYLLNYIVEGHRLLSVEHLEALKNLAIIASVSVGAICLIIFARKSKYKRL